MARIRRLTGGRAWVARLSGLLVMAAIVALIVAVLPVLAGNGPDIPPASTAGVMPVAVNLGGQGGDCDAVSADGEFELRIENPQPGASVSANHGAFDVTFTITNVYPLPPNGIKGEAFSWTLDAAGTDLVVKGGSESAHYDYTDGHGGAGVAVGGDSDNHATAQNKNRLHSVSHATVCYDVVASISGTVWHDNDQDGVFDDGTDDPGPPIVKNPDEDPQSGWIVRAYDSSGAVVASTGAGGTLADGLYSFPDLPIGETYTVCVEDLASEQWGQSIPTSGVCGINDVTHDQDEEDNGHEIDLQGDATADFGNFTTVDVGCGLPILDPTGEHSITLPPVGDLCDKDPSPAEYVLETYTRGSGAGEEQVHDFHAIEPVTGNAHVSEVHTWLISQSQNDSTLMYDDGDGPFEALYCEFVPANVPFQNLDDITDLYPDGGGGDDGKHTTCIITSTEDADGNRVDTLASLIDGRRWM